MDSLLRTRERSSLLMLSHRKHNHESINRIVKFAAGKNPPKKIARDLDSSNVLRGLMVSSGGTAALTHLSTWAEEAVSM